MTGTLVNTAAIVIGAMIGVIIKKGIPERFKDDINRMLGISVFVIGMNGIITSMISVDQKTGQLNSDGGILLLVSLVVGYVIGELLRLDCRFNELGLLVEKELRSEGFATGFINASLVFCVGAMAIIGSLNDGLYGDYSILFVKSGLDFIGAMIMASSLGIGVLFSFIPVLLYQGGITLGAKYLSPYLSDVLMGDICMVGFVIVACIGLQFLDYKRIKTANMLPCLLIPVFWHIIKAFF